MPVLAFLRTRGWRVAVLAKQARQISALPPWTDYHYGEVSSSFGSDSITTGERDMKKGFDKYGFVILRRVLNDAEVKHIKRALEGNAAIMDESLVVDDGSGRESRMCLWNHPGHDVTGMVSRSEKIAGTMEKLLGGEVYHYHTKLMMKEAFTGGSFVWHQDYGYWYQNGCLYPHMGTAFIAIDKCTEENGCMQVIPGSNETGRIEHGRVAGQTGADEERVEAIKERLGEVYVDLDPGDVLFFHSLLLHKSNQNNSALRRWAFLCAYNLASNDPILDHHHPRYTPLEKVSDSTILECQNFTDLSGKDFMHPSRDKTSFGRKAS